MEDQEKKLPEQETPASRPPDEGPPEPPPPQYQAPQYQPPPPPQSPPPSRTRSIVGPLLLILIGVLILLYNLGWIEWSIWELLWRFWPVWLIAVGLDLLLGRRGAWGAILAVGIIVTLVAGAIYYTGLWSSPRATGEWTAPAATQPATTVAQPLEGAKEATVKISSGVARFWLRGGAASGMLVDGSVVPLEGEQVIQSHETDGETAYFSLRSDYDGPLLLPRPARAGRWDLALSDEVPIALSLDLGVGESDVDLTGVKLTGLRLDSGVGETTLTLPGSGQFEARVTSGVGEMTIRIPESLAARIGVDTGIGQVTVRGDYLQENGYYVSRNWSSAENRVELQVASGVGAVRIERITSR